MKYIEREIFKNELEFEYRELFKMQKQIYKDIINHFESDTLYIRYNFELKLIIKLKQQMKEKSIYHSA